MLGGGELQGRAAPELGALADKAARVTLARMVSSLIELATVVLLVRLLVQADVAAFAFLLLVYESAKHLATQGFPESVLYFFERLGKSAHRAFALQTAALLACTGLMAGGALLLLRALLPWALDGWEAEALARVDALLPAFALVVILEVPTWPTSNMMIAADRSADAARYQVLSSLGLFAALFAPLVLGWGPEAIAITLVGYAVVRFAASLWWLHRILEGRAMWLPRDVFRAQVAFSLPLGINNLAVRFNKYIDKYIVALLLTDVALAEYQVGANELPLVTVVPYAVGAVFLASFVSLRSWGDTGALLALWHQAVAKVSLVVLPAALLAVFFAADIVRLLFGEGWSAAVPVFQVYALLLLQRVGQYGALLQAYAETRAILRITVVMLVLNALLSVPMTLRWGPTGAAVATLCASVFGWWLYQHRIARVLGVGWRQVMPWRRYGQVLAVSGGAALVAWGLRVSLVSEEGAALGLGLGLLVGSGLSWFGLRWVGVFSASDAGHVRRWLSPRFWMR